VSIRLRLRLPLLSLTASAALSAFLSACLPTFPSTTPAASAVVDDFSDADLSARYNVQGGSWRVVDGALSTLGDRNLPLWLRAPLSKNVRIQFSSRSQSPAVDMKVEVFGDGIRHESGYIVIVGGWNNTLTVIAKQDEHEPTRVTKRTRLEANRTYQWTVERTDGKTLRLLLDGEEVVRYVDEEPLFGPRHSRFAFSGWESAVTFDDLRITPLP